MIWDLLLSDQLLQELSELLLGVTPTQLHVDLLMLNALLSITRTEGLGWDASRGQSMKAIKQERLLALSELV